MMNLLNNYYKKELGINDILLNLANKTEKLNSETFDSIQKIKEYNQLKVIRAMQKHQLSDSHFAESTGYGYGDRGRDIIDAVYAEVFQAEDALVRPHIVNGTHALTLCLFGVLRTGDELLSITGKPYDTLEEVIGIRGEGAGSLKDYGIGYSQVDLLPDGKINLKEAAKKISDKTKLVLIQRSMGYGWRPSLRIDDIRKAVEFVKNIKKDIVVMVDNCYGEFVESEEPTQAGADLVAGSLIKNPGGGIAKTGGYIAGKAKWVEQAAYRLTSPGIGKEVGANMGMNREILQGLFLAPHIVAESLKGAVFCASIMQMLGFETFPTDKAMRSDIIQAIKFGKPELLIAFCQGIQKGSPVDSYVTPQPWDMPGYDSQVIMAAGAFIQGSSIELSADAPIKEPYIAYMQGGLVYEHAKLGVLMAVQNMIERKLVNL